MERLDAPALPGILVCLEASPCVKGDHAHGLEVKGKGNQKNQTLSRLAPRGLSSLVRKSSSPRPSSLRAAIFKAPVCWRRVSLSWGWPKANQEHQETGNRKPGRQTREEEEGKERKRKIVILKTMRLQVLRSITAASSLRRWGAAPVVHLSTGRSNSNDRFPTAACLVALTATVGAASVCECHEEDERSKIQAEWMEKQGEHAWLEDVLGETALR